MPHHRVDIMGVKEQHIRYCNLDSLSLLCLKMLRFKKHKMSLNNTLEVDIFYVYGIDFMGTFPSSRGNQYILVSIYYVSKWVEAILLPTNHAKIVVKFIRKHSVDRLEPRGLSSFMDIRISSITLFIIFLDKYGVRHKESTTYHPKTTRHVKVSHGD